MMRKTKKAYAEMFVGRAWRSTRYSLPFAFIFALQGCSSEGVGTATVQGTVTLDGELATSGNIVFHSKADHPTAYGVIGNAGAFTMRIGQGNLNNVNRSKIYAGDYIATVTLSGPPIENTEFAGAPPLPGPRLSAARYANKATSRLEYTVKSGMNVVNIEVESPSEKELAAIRAEAEQAAKSAENTEAKKSNEAETSDEDDTQAADPAVTTETPTQQAAQELEQ